MKKISKYKCGKCKNSATLMIHNDPAYIDNSVYDWTGEEFIHIAHTDAKAGIYCNEHTPLVEWDPMTVGLWIRKKEEVA